MKKLILLLLASFVMTSSYAQFFKRKNPVPDKPQKEMRAEKEESKEDKEAAKAAKDAAKKAEEEAKKAEKEAKKEEKNAKKEAKKQAKLEKDLSPVKLSEKEKDNPPLEGVKWALLDISGKPLKGDMEATPYILMSGKGGNLTGHTGCNNLSGSFDKGRHNDISFKPVMTKKACLDQNSEDYLIDALNKTNAYMLNGQNLILYHDNLMLAIFEVRFE